MSPVKAWIFLGFLLTAVASSLIGFSIAFESTGLKVPEMVLFRCKADANPSGANPQGGLKLSEMLFIFLRLEEKKLNAKMKCEHSKASIARDYRVSSAQ